MIIDHTTDVSVCQSVPQGINRFYFFFFSSVDADNDIQISRINLIIIIHIDGTDTGFLQPVFLFVVSFHPYLVTGRFNPLQSFVCTDPHITFLIFGYCKYTLDFTGQSYTLTSVSFRVNLYQSIRSTYPQTVPGVQAETMNNCFHFPAFAVFQLKSFYAFRKRIDNDYFSEIIAQPDISVPTFIYMVMPGETGPFFPRLKMCIHRKHRSSTSHNAPVSHRQPDISFQIFNYTVYSGLKNLPHPAIHTIADIKLHHSATKGTHPENLLFIIP